MTDTVTAERPILKLIGTDGNAYAVLGKASTVARRAGWPPEQINEFLRVAMAGDYNDLLATCMKYFDVR